jgi:hypothetical protein
MQKPALLPFVAMVDMPEDACKLAHFKELPYQSHDWHELPFMAGILA